MWCDDDHSHRPFFFFRELSICCKSSTFPVSQPTHTRFCVCGSYTSMRVTCGVERNEIAEIALNSIRRGRRWNRVRFSVNKLKATADILAGWLADPLFKLSCVMISILDFRFPNEPQPMRAMNGEVFFHFSAFVVHWSLFNVHTPKKKLIVIHHRSSSDWV